MIGECAAFLLSTISCNTCIALFLWPSLASARVETSYKSSKVEFVNVRKFWWNIINNLNLSYILFLNLSWSTYVASRIIIIFKISCDNNWLEKPMSVRPKYRVYIWWCGSNYKRHLQVVQDFLTTCLEGHNQEKGTNSHQGMKKEKEKGKEKEKEKIASTELTAKLQLPLLLGPSHVDSGATSSVV